MRNGNRWRVAGIDPATNRVAAERLDDRARVVFENEYLREHVSLGYAVTVHSAQGVTADTSHAVLGENTSRAMLYVAMTRGRHTNTAYIYERPVEQEYGQQLAPGMHIPKRSTSHQASDLMRAVIANHGEQPMTAHDFAARSIGRSLPERVSSLVERRQSFIHDRCAKYESWQTQMRSHDHLMEQAHQRAVSLSRGRDHGLSL